MDRRAWIIVAVVTASVALAVAGVGFALAARDLRVAAVAVGGWTNPPTVIRPSHSVLLGQTRSLARLETASATMEQRVVGQRGTDGSWSWIGERIVFVARGEVTAGVDLGNLDAEALVVAPDGTVVLTLPDVDILHVTVDEEASFVAARERGWFGMPDADLETEARREAVRALEAAARRSDLLDEARRGAQETLRALLLDAGAAAVDIR